MTRKLIISKKYGDQKYLYSLQVQSSVQKKSSCSPWRPSLPRLSPSSETSWNANLDGKMKTISPQRSEIFKILADQILKLDSTTALRVAIDGVDGAGKTVFANELEDILKISGRQIIRASVDGFHNPKYMRYRLAKTPLRVFILTPITIQA